MYQCVSHYRRRTYNIRGMGDVGIKLFPIVTCEQVHSVNTITHWRWKCGDTLKEFGFPADELVPRASLFPPGSSFLILHLLIHLLTISPNAPIFYPVIKLSRARPSFFLGCISIPCFPPLYPHRLFSLPP